METKLCGKCGRELPATDECFIPRRDRPGRFHVPCRECRRASARETYLTNAEARKAKLAKNAEWRIANPDKMLAYIEKYKSTEKYGEWLRRYQNENRDGLRAANRRYYWRNRERELSRSKSWREANRELFQQIVERWIAAGGRRANEARYRRRHPERHRAKVSRYRARLLAATVEPVDYEAILIRDGMICHICGGEIEGVKQLDFDHVVPLARGGEHSMVNVKPSHRRCNRRKGDKLLAA